jgi:hypothetical protein
MSTIKKIMLILLSVFIFSNAYAGENKVSIIDIETNTENSIKVFIDKEIFSDSKKIT